MCLICMQCRNFQGGTRGVHHFFIDILYPAASNGDLFFQNSEWWGGTRGGGGHMPTPHIYATVCMS